MTNRGESFHCNLEVASMSFWNRSTYESCFTRSLFCSGEAGAWGAETDRNRELSGSDP